jgi:hypothetical protein
MAARIKVGAMTEFPLSKVCRLLESEPVVLLTTAGKVTVIVVFLRPEIASLIWNAKFNTRAWCATTTV